MRSPIPRHLETVPAAPATSADVDAQLLSIFFDRMPMGIAVFGADLKLQRCSKTWSGFFVNYLGVAEDYVTPGRDIFELIPDNEEALRPLLEGVLAGNVVRQQAHRLEKDGIVTYWDVVFAPTFRDGEVVGFVDIVTDATQRRLAYEALEARVAVLSRLASSITVDQPVEATIRQATAAAVEATGAVGAASLVQTSTATPRLFAAAGLPDGYGDALSAAWKAGAGGPQQQAIQERRRRIVRGAATLARADPAFAPLHPFIDGSWEDVVVIPVETRAEQFGTLTLYYTGDYDFEDELPVLQAIADLAASALENARLYAGAEQHAADLERQRLARELHDSVSQALFSMTLHARTAQRLLGRLDLPADEQVSAQLTKLCDLTTGALAEMRALIFELRPGALAEEGLAAALTRQAQALTARDGLPIVVRAPDHRVFVDPTVEEHLYRIALEALHNTVKHAQARHATVDITADEAARLVLRITDDGVGFDPTRARPGHMGQHTMRERATAIGATLEVISSQNAGTSVQVTLPPRAG